MGKWLGSSLSLRQCRGLRRLLVRDHQSSWRAAVHADTEAARMQAFLSLDRQQQADAIRRLAATGMSDNGIARATGLSVEMVCRLLVNETRATAADAAPTGTDNPTPAAPPYGLLMRSCAMGNCEGD
jgi:hypothetical protein